MTDRRNEYLPDVVSPPGETLADALAERGMTQADLADRTGRPRKTINEIVKGKASITADTALQLESVLGTPASFWTNRQRAYDEYLARKNRRKSLTKGIRWLRDIPVREIIRRGFARKASEETDQVSECLKYFGIASVEQWEKLYLEPQAHFRKSSRFVDDVGATAAWLREGELRSQKMIAGDFDRERFKDALRGARGFTRFSDPAIFIPAVQTLCSPCGVVVVFVPEYPGSKVGGATRWLAPNKALILLTARTRRADILWFNFFHEAGHVVLHKKKDVFLDGIDPPKGNDEGEADNFARNLLIPVGTYDAFVRTGDFSEGAVRTFANTVGVAPGTVVGRLHADEHLDRSALKSLFADVELPAPY